MTANTALVYLSQRRLPRLGLDGGSSIGKRVGITGREDARELRLGGTVAGCAVGRRPVRVGAPMRVGVAWAAGRAGAASSERGTAAPERPTRLEGRACAGAAVRAASSEVERVEIGCAGAPEPDLVDLGLTRLEPELRRAGVPAPPWEPAAVGGWSAPESLVTKRRRLGG